MPHFGLMDEQEMGPEEGPLLRARLHIRSGRRRLRQGKTAAAVATLADALNSAFRWYLAAAERRRQLQVQDGENLNDDRTLHRILVRSGVLDGSFDYDAFDRDLERALEGEETGIDGEKMMADLESLMLQLGVMPLDEEALPPENPETY